MRELSNKQDPIPTGIVMSRAELAVASLRSRPSPLPPAPTRDRGSQRGSRGVVRGPRGAARASQGISNVRQRERLSVAYDINTSSPVDFMSSVQAQARVPQSATQLGAPAYPVTNTSDTGVEAKGNEDGVNRITGLAGSRFASPPPAPQPTNSALPPHLQRGQAPATSSASINPDPSREGQLFNLSSNTERLVGKVPSKSS
jgi:hypothetical protein